MIPDETPTTLESADAALVADAAPETPAETAPASEQPRDEQGRFTSPPQSEPAAEQAPVETPETPGEPAAAAPEVEAPAEETYEPFVYRADGQDFDIPGSAVGDDGVFIPTDKIPELQQLLSEGRASRGSVRQRFSEIAQREQAAVKRAEAAEAQSQQVLSHFENLIETGKFPEWLQNVAQNWPILKAEAKAKALELQAQAERDELTRYREQNQMAAMRPVMDETLERTIKDYGLRYGLDADGMEQVFNLLHEPQYESLTFVRAPHDDLAAGFRKGDLVINYNTVEGAIRLATAGRGAQQKIQQAVKQNQVQPVKVPPTVGGKTTKAPKPGPAVPQFKTTKEADEWFERGGFMDLEVPEPE